MLDMYGNKYISKGFFMKLIGSRKFTWILCGIGFLIAAVSVFFLPQLIPVHCSIEIVEDCGDNMELFLFPILLVVIAAFTENKKLKQIFTRSETCLTSLQYNLIVSGVLGGILFTEIYAIYALFM